MRPSHTIQRGKEAICQIYSLLLELRWHSLQRGPQPTRIITHALIKERRVARCVGDAVGRGKGYIRERTSASVL